MNHYFILEAELSKFILKERISKSHISVVDGKNRINGAPYPW